MRQLDSTETKKYTLEVYECDCGFHIGLDYTYLDQVGELRVECPCCKRIINTKQISFQET